MYKGYKIEKGESFYKIYDEKGTACGVGCIGYLKDRSEKAVIDEFFKRMTPKKPRKSFETSSVKGKLHIQIRCYCPECGWYLGNADDVYRYERCQNCYQTIDWSGA